MPNHEMPAGSDEPKLERDMSMVEICCPNCGSPSATKQGDEYICDYCKGKFQIVNTNRTDARPKDGAPQLRYGRINFKVDDAKTIGTFTMEKKADLTHIFSQVFRYHAYKTVTRGGRNIVANEFGYVFVNPFTGKINGYGNTENALPDANACKTGEGRDCLRLISANSFEDRPIEEIKGMQNALLLAGLQKTAFSFIVQNLSVNKTYVVHGSKYATGVRQFTIRFSKANFDQFISVGCVGVPVFHLYYKHPNSTRIFKRSVLGFSGEVFEDELICTKIKMLGKKCENLPDYACAVCGDLVCAEHSEKCEKCGAILHENCVTTTGTLLKHHYCKKCALPPST